jgi:hypothetical protein
MTSFPVWRLAVAAGIYAGLLMLHWPVIGVSPWPG